MKLILKMVFPMFLSTAINFILSFIDTMIVGHLGIQELGATAAGSSLYSIYVQVVGALIIGFQVMGAQEIVKKGKNRLTDYFQTTLFLMYIISIIFIFISLIFSKQLLWMFSTPSIIAGAQTYFFARLPALLILPLSICIKTEYDIQKKTKIGLYYTIVVVLTDIILDVVLIYIVHLGVFGAGLSDTLAMFIGLIFLLMRNNQDGIVKFQHFIKLKKIERKLISELNELNLPEVVNMLLDYLGTSVLFIIISRISVLDIAAGRISSIYIKIIFSLAINIGTVVQILLVRNALEMQSKKYIMNAFKLSAIILVPFTVVAIVVPQLFIIPFTNNISLIKLFNSPMRLLWFVLLLVPAITIMTGILRSKKRNKENMYVNVFSTWLLQVPAAFIFCIILKIGIWRFVLSYLCYFLGRIVGNLFFLIKESRGRTNEVLE